MSDTQSSKNATYKSQSMLVKLTIKKWTATVTDKRVTSEAISQNLAQDDAGTFRKRLIPRTDKDFKAIGSAASKLRQYHKTMTVPWENGGRDLLSARAFLEYKAEMTQLTDNFDSAVRTFVAVYQQKLNDSQVMLGNMFQAGDYPSSVEVNSLYGISLNMEPLPSGEDFNAPGIPQEMIDEERAKIEADVSQKVQAAHKSLYQRLEKVASNVVEVLNREEPNFKRSFITQVLETAEILEMLDIEGDEKLHERAEKIRDAVNSAGYDALKNSVNERKRVASDVEDELEEITRTVDEMA